jgi:hypothetical protein
LREGERIAPEKVAREAVTMAIAGCGKITEDPEWRRLNGLDKISIDDQDFIFNEVLCATLMTVYAGLDETVPYLPGDRRDFWRQVAAAFYPTYQKWQIENGVKNSNEWKKFFDLRLAEYEEGQKDTYQVFRDQLSKMPSEDDRHATVRAITISAICMSHICRGKKTPKDEENIRCLQKHLGRLVKDNWRRFGW